MAAVRVCVSSHPLVQHKLTLLRDAQTRPPVFRALVHDLSLLLACEALADLRSDRVTVQTPMGVAAGQRLAETVGLAPILRAGLGMAEALLVWLPDAQVWHLGLYRDETTLRPVTYYNRLPPTPAVQLCLVLDPMLATGGSAVATVDILKRWGAPRIKFMGLIAAPEGVARLTAAHPDVDIHLAAIDDHLNGIGYIVPGLGDAGDRQFGTG